MVVEGRDGVVYEVPVARAVPPEILENQLMVPALAEADKVNVPLTHAVPPVTELIVGSAFTVATTADLLEEEQLPFTAAAK